MEELVSSILISDDEKRRLLIDLRIAGIEELKMELEDALEEDHCKKESMQLAQNDVDMDQPAEQDEEDKEDNQNYSELQTVSSCFDALINLVGNTSMSLGGKASRASQISLAYIAALKLEKRAYICGYDFEPTE
uniref:Uncharacterized protein n=1 Tax=Ditylenchus dipsaci TaxID=166011 RepID=A0A915ERA5_9BILA